MGCMRVGGGAPTRAALEHERRLCARSIRDREVEPGGDSASTTTTSIHRVPRTSTDPLEALPTLACSGSGSAHPGGWRWPKVGRKHHFC